MSATTEPTTAAEVEFQPHRRWYKRREVIVPILIAAAVYGVLIFGVEETRFFRTRMQPDGTTNFDWMFFWHLVPLMFQALLVLIKGTVLGFTVAAVLGLLLALGRRSPSRLLSWPVTALIEFIRSTPLLVQLFFIVAIVRASEGISLTGVQMLTIGLGLHYATYCSEGYRAGIDSVPAGQWEASTSLNLGPWTKWTQVILPQAIPNVLPALGNFLIAAFKDAPMAFIIPVAELLFFAQTVRGDTFRVTEPFLLVGVGFLMVSLPAAWAVRRLEERISYER